MGHYRWTTWLWLILLLEASSEALCPRECRCDAGTRSRKQVVCSNGRMEGNVPINQIDNDVQRIVITAPVSSPNVLNLGKVFYNLQRLEELHITRSSLPAIGDATFVGLINLLTLNLTSNNISLLLETNFKGLDALTVLHLDDNAINSTPSAVFRPLANLRRLTISRNRLDKLSPRMFFGLKNLEVLDLSGNPLHYLEADRFEDVPSLKMLRLSDCALRHFESSIAEKLPFLETLDLSNNLLPFFSAEYSHHMGRLQVLYLHGNRMHAISEHNFRGLQLRTLTLAFNSLQFLPANAFNNLTVQELDLSFNGYYFKDFLFLKVIAQHIQVLYLGGNDITERVLADLLTTLPKLRTLGIAHLGLGDPSLASLNLPNTIRKLNLSGNSLTYMDIGVLRSLPHLESLDLSRNIIHGLGKQLLVQLDSMPRLKTLYLGGNPWSCDQCYIPDMLVWLNNTRFFQHACQNVGNTHCLRCSTPQKLLDRPIQFLDHDTLDQCPYGFGPAWAQSSSMGATQIGVVVACVLLIILTCFVLLILAMYYRRGAEYYTHEEERDDNGVYENPAVDDDIGELLVPSAATKQQTVFAANANSNANSANGSKSKYGA